MFSSQHPAEGKLKQSYGGGRVHRLCVLTLTLFHNVFASERIV